MSWNPLDWNLWTSEDDGVLTKKKTTYTLRGKKSETTLSPTGDLLIQLIVQLLKVAIAVPILLTRAFVHVLSGVAGKALSGVALPPADEPLGLGPAQVDASELHPRRKRSKRKRKSKSRSEPMSSGKSSRTMRDVGE